MFLLLFSLLISNSFASYYSPSIGSIFIVANDAFKKGNVIKVLDPVINNQEEINLDLTASHIKRFASDYRGLLPVPMLMYHSEMTAIKKYYTLQTVISASNGETVMTLTFLDSNSNIVSSTTSIVSLSRPETTNKKVNTVYNILNKNHNHSQTISKSDIKEAIVSLYSQIGQES